MKELDFNQPAYLPTEGSGGFKALCGLARHMGYDTYPPQLYNSDGTTVSSLINMLEDNPGMIKAIFEWVDENKCSWECFDEPEEEIEEDETTGSDLVYTDP